LPGLSSLQKHFLQEQKWTTYKHLPMNIDVT
jgi:hypothetical protein